MSLPDRSALSEQRDTFSKTLIVFISQCDRPFTPQNLACDLRDSTHPFQLLTAYTLLQLNHCMCTPHKTADLLSNLFVSQMSVFNGPFRCLHHSVITRTATENEWVVYLCGIIVFVVVVVCIQRRLMLLDWHSSMRFQMRTMAKLTLFMFLVKN